MNYNIWKFILLSLALSSMFLGCNKKITVINESRFLHKGNEIIIHDSTIDDVLKFKYGKFSLKDWGEFSREYKFDRTGLSFTHKQSDSSRVINWITLFPKRCKADLMGLMTINKRTTVNDIVSIFGKGEWTYTDDSTELTLDYEFMDIEVAVDKSLLIEETHSFYELEWGKYLERYKDEFPLMITFY